MIDPTMTPGRVPAMMPGPAVRRSGLAASTGTALRVSRSDCEQVGGSHGRAGRAQHTDLEGQEKDRARDTRRGRYHGDDVRRTEKDDDLGPPAPSTRSR